ncbi:MAG TPA: DUF1800 domain-containing protein [Rhodothermales bacterium]|nr:DUF1800 domain-containing protein [Rhodothermales bacterium]
MAAVLRQNDSSLLANSVSAVGWSRQNATHLVRRTTFGAMKRDVDAALADGSASAAANRIVDAAAAVPLPDRPAWYADLGTGSDTERIYALQRLWFEEMRSGGLREKMALFWHNHFVTQWPTYSGKSDVSAARLAWDYLELIRKHAMGNFRVLLHDMGLNPAMLYYLDGYINTSGAANENYAREVMELFTMGQFDEDGQPNYAETDIKQIARALTGWMVTSKAAASFNPALHDEGTKSFLGQTGNFGYDDVVDALIETRANQIAWFICKKLYCYFVQAEPDDTVIDSLAATFIASDWEIAPVLKKLFSSDAFYSSTLIAARIKSPVEYLIGCVRECEITPTTELYEYIRVSLTPERLNQELLNPPNVAGWPGLNPPGSDGAPGQRSWLTTGTLPDRWNMAEQLIYGYGATNFDPVDLGRKISDPSNPYLLPTDLAHVMLAVPLSVAGIRDVEAPFGGDPMAPPPQAFLDGPAYSVSLCKIMLDGMAHYEWPVFSEKGSEEDEAARTLLRAYLTYLVELPAYQLT